MTFTKGKYYYVRYAWTIERWKCMEIVNGTPIFKSRGELRHRSPSDIIGEVVKTPFPWRNLIATLAALTLAFSIGFVEGRLHTPIETVNIEADK